MNDEPAIRALLERGAGPLAPVDTTSVRARAGRHRRRRQGAWALGVIAVLAAVSASLLYDGVEETRQLDTVSTGTTATTGLRWPPPRSSLPPLSMTEGLPPADDPFRQQLDRERATGWMPVAIGEDTGFVPAELLGSAEDGPIEPGGVAEVVDADLRLIGYWIFPGGPVDPATFEDPGFDWRAFIRERGGEEMAANAEEQIAQIEAAGGLQEPIRVAESR